MEFDFKEITEESKIEESGDTAAEPEETAEDTKAEETEEEKTHVSADDPAKQDDTTGEEPTQNIPEDDSDDVNNKKSE